MIRLQSRMAGRNAASYTKDLVYTLSVAVGKLGPNVLLGALEALQSGYVPILKPDFWSIHIVNVAFLCCSMSTMFVKNVWFENVVRARGAIEKKACVVGLTRLMCESEFCTSNLEMWKESMLAALKVLEEGDDGVAGFKDEDESLLELEQTGYEAGYSKLFFASVIPVDYLAEYPPAKQYLTESVAKLSASRPGMVCILLALRLIVRIFTCC